jgi:hypothetical protein
LAERDHGGSFRDEGHIEDDARLLNRRGTQEAYDSHNTWPPVIMWEHDRKQVGRWKEVRYNNKFRGDSKGERPSSRPKIHDELRGVEMVITKGGSPAPRTSTGPRASGYNASRDRSKDRGRDRNIMARPALPANNEGRAHHLRLKLVGGTGPQKRERYKKKSCRQECNQKVLASKENYSLRSRIVKERRRVRQREKGKRRYSGRHRNMARLKHTQRKRIPLGKDIPESSRRLTRIEQVAREVENTFHTLVSPKGKATVNKWEEEIKEERSGKEWGEIAQEAEWITDLGATRPRETLYHKTIEMTWFTKMLIGKVKSDREEARQEDHREVKTMLDEIQRRISGLETIIKLLVEVEKDQKSKQERLVAQFHLYLRYVHHMDITPMDGQGGPTQIRRTRTVSPKEDNKGQAGGVKDHPQVL